MTSNFNILHATFKQIEQNATLVIVNQNREN